MSTVNEAPAEPATQASLPKIASGRRSIVSLERLLRRFRSERLVVAARGSVWSLLGYGSGQVLRLASTLVLARSLLTPRAFGLVALTTIFLSGLDMLSDLGVGMDVVQHRRGDDQAFLSTAFLVSAARGLLLWSVAACLAFPFAAFYNQPEIKPLAIIGALSIAIRGLASSSVWTMTRHVQMRKLTLLTASSEVIGLFASVIWAVLSPTAWALVAGRVATSIAFTIGSHFVGDRAWRKLQWDASAARDIMTFGSGILLSSGTYFLSAEAERLILGKFINVDELGCYSLALAISAAPASALLQVVGQVFFPLIAASIRTSVVATARHYLKARRVFSILSILVGSVFITCSNWVVSSLLPPRYRIVGWMLHLLGIRAAINVFSAPAVSLVLARGDSGCVAASNCIRLILTVVGILGAFTWYGLHEAVAVLVVASIAAYLFLLFGVARHLRAVLREEIVSFAFLGCWLVVLSGVTTT